jgi:hypothetical protein
MAPRSRPTRRTARLAAMVIAFGCLTPASVAAAEGNVGSHFSTATCLTVGGQRELIVITPAIYSSPAPAPPNVVIVGNQHPQWVAYQIVVFYAPTLDTAWEAVVQGQWHAALVGDEANTLQPSSWWIYGTDTQTDGVETYNLNANGYFKAAVRYYWWADERTGAGSDFLWVDYQYDYDANTAGTVQYCVV